MLWNVHNKVEDVLIMHKFDVTGSDSFLCHFLDIKRLLLMKWCAWGKFWVCHFLTKSVIIGSVSPNLDHAVRWYNETSLCKRYVAIDIINTCHYIVIQLNRNYRRDRDTGSCPSTLVSNKLNIPFFTMLFQLDNFVTAFKFIFEETMPKLSVYFGNHIS